MSQARSASVRSGILVGALVAVAAMIAGCGGSGKSGTGPIRVYPNDADFSGRADITIVSASMTEDALRPTQEQLRLELAVANTGSVAVSGFTVQEGRIEASGLDLPLDLALDAATNRTPISTGETRHLIYGATLVPLGICLPAFESQPNPHHGLVTVGFTFLSSAGAKAIAGVDVALTCDFVGTPPPDAGMPDVPISDAGMMIPDARAPDTSDAEVSDAGMPLPDAEVD